MLAFNLGVFFRNLRGAEVSFSARNPACEMHFVGGVEHLREHTDLNRRLSVSLSRGELICHIAFEDREEEDAPESTEVDVQVIQRGAGREVTLLQTRFLFEEITLKPWSPGDETPPPDEPKTA
ncbi:MAG: hypothetical protein HY423_10970 [Candidatus Lambdaproteobacteria bacterium]|nr:hypothetical protein [Candidatus Lambdaproteobacteria bacterium]